MGINSVASGLLERALGPGACPSVGVGWHPEAAHVPLAESLGEGLRGEGGWRAFSRGFIELGETGRETDKESAR
jgi:hypothetical protein